MNFFDLINAVNSIFDLLKNFSEIPHTDKMPDMLFLFGVSLSSNKGEKDKNKQK